MKHKKIACSTSYLRNDIKGWERTKLQFIPFFLIKELDTALKKIAITNSPEILNTYRQLIKLFEKMQHILTITLECAKNIDCNDICQFYEGLDVRIKNIYPETFNKLLSEVNFKQAIGVDDVLSKLNNQRPSEEKMKLQLLLILIKRLPQNEQIIRRFDESLPETLKQEKIITTFLASKSSAIKGSMYRKPLSQSKY